MIRVNLGKSGDTSLLEINVEIDGAGVKPTKNGASGRREGDGENRPGGRRPLGQAELTVAAPTSRQRRIRSEDCEA